MFSILKKSECYHAARRIGLIVFLSLPFIPAGAEPPLCDATVKKGNPNNACAALAEKKSLNEIAEGPWQYAECDLRRPVMWKSEVLKDNNSVLIRPNDNSEFAQYEFMTIVRFYTRNRNGVDLLEDRLYKSWSNRLEEKDAEEQLDLEDWIEKQKHKSADAASWISRKEAKEKLIKKIELRYINGYLQGRGEGISEYEDVAPILHDGKSGKWRSSFEIKQFPSVLGYGEPNEADGPLTVQQYVCEARQEMSIEAFSMLCVTIWERSMLSTIVADCIPDSEAISPGREAAMQVLDRWNLLKNLGGTLKGVVSRFGSALWETARQLLRLGSSSSAHTNLILIQHSR